jgi:4-hydroxy-4-methyl-2-oxoglutarate aldolase
LVVGDADGVVVLPAASVATTLDRAEQREAKESQILEELRRGKSTLELYGFK